MGTNGNCANMLFTNCLKARALCINHDTLLSCAYLSGVMAGSGKCLCTHYLRCLASTKVLGGFKALDGESGAPLLAMPSTATDKDLRALAVTGWDSSEDQSVQEILRLASPT